MADTFSPEKRSDIMRQVKGKRTVPEQKLERALKTNNLKFERNAPDLPGKPDFVFRTAKVVIFVDGCFWHGCPEHFRLPETRKDYWSGKIIKNKIRATQQTQKLVSEGWECLHIWEHEIKRDIQPCVDSIISLLSSSKKRNKRAMSK